jgi:hypothetical protein
MLIRSTNATICRHAEKTFTINEIIHIANLSRPPNRYEAAITITTTKMVSVFVFQFHRNNEHCPKAIQQLSYYYQYYYQYQYYQQYQQQQ